MAIRNLYWGNVVAIVPTVGAALATLIYALRLIACRMSTVGWRLEELLMGIGLILSYGVTAFVIYSEYSILADFSCSLRVPSRLQWCRSSRA